MLKDKKSKIFVTVFILCLAIVSVWIGTSLDSKKSTVGAFDPKNATYQINGVRITLKDGVSEISIASSSSKVITRYFGNEAKGDLDGDGTDDVAFLITQENGGSGIFYYAVVALSKPLGYVMTNPFFIGDRIAPQSTEINESARELYINYADRNKGEPMSTQPSVGSVKLLKVTSAGVLTGLMK